MRRIVCKIAALIGAVLFSQMPLFVDQYTFRLQGHLAESNHHLLLYQKAAAELHKTVDEYMQKFLSSQDEDFCKEGEIIQHVVDRNLFLQKAVCSLETQPKIIRPLLLFKYADVPILKEAWESFCPGFSFSTETAFFSLLGAFLAFFITHALTGVKNYTRSHAKNLL